MLLKKVKWKKLREWEKFLSPTHFFFFSDHTSCIIVLSSVYRYNYQQCLTNISCNHFTLLIIHLSRICIVIIYDVKQRDYNPFLNPMLIWLHFSLNLQYCSLFISFISFSLSLFPLISSFLSFISSLFFLFPFFFFHHNSDPV